MRDQEARSWAGECRSATGNTGKEEAVLSKGRETVIETDRESFEIRDCLDRLPESIVLMVCADLGEVEIVRPVGARPLSYGEAQALAAHLARWCTPEQDELRALRRSHARLLEELGEAVAGANGHGAPAPASTSGRPPPRPRGPALVRVFLRERAVFRHGATAQEVVYDDYLRWADARGEWTLSFAEFRRSVSGQPGITAITGADGTPLWRGLALCGAEPATAVKRPRAADERAEASPHVFLFGRVEFGRDHIVTKRFLYERYCAWATSRGERPLSEAVFSAAVGAKPGVTGFTAGDGERWWRGLALCEPVPATAVKVPCGADERPKASPERFLAEAVRVAPGAGTWHVVLWDAYRNWATRHGEQPFSDGAFAMAVGSLDPGAVVAVSDGGRLYWRGLMLNAVPAAATAPG